MKFLYLDKKDRIRAWFTNRRQLMAALISLVLVTLPLWRESASGKFILEPARRAIIRAHVPGTISDTFVGEGQNVRAGTPVATLRNLPLQSSLEQADAQLTVATDRAKFASLHYSDYGAAGKEREHLAVRDQQLYQHNSELQVSSPIAGRILTERVGDLQGKYLTEGRELLTVADVSALRARIYISEYDLHRVREGAPGKLQVQGFLRTWEAQTVGIAPEPTEMDPQLMGNVKLKGTNPPHFYFVDLVVFNSDGMLKPGMIGYARVYGRRRSILGMVSSVIMNFWGRKLW